MPTVANFLPSTRALGFPNSWPNYPHATIPTPFGDIAIGSASNGMCGGMVFAVRDYFEAGTLPPSGRQPGPGEPLYDFIVERLYASFDLPLGPTKYYDWMTTADHDTTLKTGLAHRTILEEWPKIQNDLDNGRLSCLALVTIYSLNPGDMGYNHQVLAYGYDLSPANVLTLKLYDPNFSDYVYGTRCPAANNVTLSLSLSDPSHTTPITHNVSILNPIRGFFHLPYQRVSAPAVDDAEINNFAVSQTMLAGTVSNVAVRVHNTGSTTWTSGGANPYRLGSARPQDNTTWGLSRVDVPHPVNPTEDVDFTFAVTAPMVNGQVLMGWRMVRELVHWFGAIGERSVNVSAPVVPASECDQLRSEILAAQEEIHALQADLQQAVGQEKTFLAAEIRRRQAELANLRSEATARGCTNIP
jgi:hypothetical protein